MPTVFTRRLAEEGRLPERIDGIPFDAREVELQQFRLPCVALGIEPSADRTLPTARIGSGPRRIPNARRRIPHHGAGNRIRENGRQPDRCRKERTFRSRDEEEGIRLSRPPYRGKRFDLQTLRQRLPVARRDRNAVPDETALRPAVRPPHRTARFSDIHVRFRHGVPRQTTAGIPRRRPRRHPCARSGLLPALPAAASRRPPTRTSDRRRRLFFYWTAITERQGFERLTALNARDYSLAAEHETDFPAPKWEQTRKYLFPFRLVFTASSDKYIKPRLRDFSYLALGLNTLLAAGWAVYSMKKRRCRTIRALGILVLGIYLLVPLLLTDRE